MLTHSLWQRRYGADPSIIGKTDHRSTIGARTVVGVLPPRFKFPDARSALHAAALGRVAALGAQHQRRGVLKSGVTASSRRRSEIAAIAKRLEEAYPESNRGYGVRVVPIRDSQVGRRHAAG